jgi:hypothetical protein
MRYSPICPASWRNAQGGAEFARRAVSPPRPHAGEAGASPWPCQKRRASRASPKSRALRSAERVSPPCKATTHAERRAEEFFAAPCWAQSAPGCQFTNRQPTRRDPVSSATARLRRAYGWPVSRALGNLGVPTQRAARSFACFAARLPPGSAPKSRGKASDSRRNAQNAKGVFAPSDPPDQHELTRLLDSAVRPWTHRTHAIDRYPSMHEMVPPRRDCPREDRAPDR